MVLSLDGSFRLSLEKAVRVEEDYDWSTHTVDYALFKRTLKKMCRRRLELRNMFRRSADGRLPEEAVQLLLGRAAPTSVFAQRDESDAHVHGEADNDTHRYVDFRELEDLTESSDVASETGKKRKRRASVLRKLSFLERKELVAFLTSEMDKAQMFYLSQWQRISLMLETRTTVDPEFPVIGEEILELIAFCVINVVTSCQILIRYDAYARTYEGTPMMDYYIKHVTRFPTSFRKISQHEELQALADSYGASVGMEALFLHFDSQRQMFSQILSATRSAQMMAATGRTFFRDSMVQTLRSWFLMGSFEDRLGLEPAYLMMWGQSLNSEMHRLVEWRQKKHEILPSSRPKKELTEIQVYNLTLNLVSAFLYCMNYYIVEPSSTMYVNRLGAFDAMSGTLIGMVPLAAFISSIPYSMWTNTSFRQPFILSCCLLVTGSLVYSLADQFKDVRVALLGRFITGLGAPKCIIRRYMADTTPVSLRTSVNALFGMVVAAGSAMGPAMAIVLNRFEYSFVSPTLGRVTLNGLTLPGYFMAVLWITFAVIVLLTFDEPDREGLEEQRRLESGGRTGNETSSAASMAQDVDLQTIFSGESQETGMISFLRTTRRELSPARSIDMPIQSLEMPNPLTTGWRSKAVKHYLRLKNFLELITTPVRICLGLLFAKVFTIEILASATSSLSKNRYQWQVHQVGTLGLANGCMVIPFSILIGRMSLSVQDQVLMRWLVSIGLCGFFLLIDLSDLVSAENDSYNVGHPLAVGPKRYIAGYFLSYLSIQAFEGIIGSTLSKVIPISLASGTFNSGLLSTLVDTFGRACGDNFISLAGFFNIRQLMDLLFIPGFLIMLTCLVVIERYRDMLSV